MVDPGWIFTVAGRVDRGRKSSQIFLSWDREDLVCEIFAGGLEDANGDLPNDPVPSPKKLAIRIESVETGDQFPVRILPASPIDLQSLEVGWLFSWEQEARRSEVFKLVQVGVPSSILGLLSILKREGFIEVLLLENSPSNVGRGKLFKRVAGCLLAFAADLSVQRGDDGYLRLTAKSELIDHYIREYGFTRLGHSQNMILAPVAAARLIANFLGRFDDGPHS